MKHAGAHATDTSSACECSYICFMLFPRRRHLSCSLTQRCKHCILCVFLPFPPLVSTCPVVLWASGFPAQVRTGVFCFPRLGLWHVGVMFLHPPSPPRSLCLLPPWSSRYFVDRRRCLFAKVLPSRRRVNGLAGCRLTCVSKRLQRNLPLLLLTECKVRSPRPRGRFLLLSVVSRTQNRPWN